MTSDARRRPGRLRAEPLDPETRAAFEASYRRNKEALDRLAKL